MAPVQLDQSPQQPWAGYKLEPKLHTCFNRPTTVVTPMTVLRGTCIKHGRRQQIVFLNFLDYVHFTGANELL